MLAAQRDLKLLPHARRATEHDADLRAQTSILPRLLTLGLVRREVVVDRRARYVTIDARCLW